MCLLSLAVCHVFFGGASLRAAKREGPWRLNDWPGAQKQARDERKPIFVVFHCPH